MELQILSPNSNLQDTAFQVGHREIALGAYAKLDYTMGVVGSEGAICFQRQFQHQGRMAGLHFCTNVKSRLTQGNKVSGAAIDDQSCNLMLILPNETTQIIEATKRFSILSIYVDLNHFASLLGGDFYRLPEIFTRSAGLGDKCSCTAYRWTAALNTAVVNILTNKRDGVAGKLYLESKMLEIIALMIEAQQTDAEFELPKIRSSDLDKIHFAREILTKNLAESPTLSSLAKQVGTNEYILKQGFKYTFGMPVFQYLYKIRMEQAFELFVSRTDLSIAEIGLQVGYSDQSAFTRAFSKRFGIAPSKLKQGG